MLQILKLSSISPTLQMMIESQVYMSQGNQHVWFKPLYTQGWKILKTSTRPTSLYVLVN